MSWSDYSNMLPISSTKRQRHHGPSWGLGLLSFALLAPTQVWATTSSVNVALNASFNSPPYLVELLETAAEENSTSYFPLLDRIAEGTFAESITEKDLYNRFVQVLQDDGHITTADAMSSFKFALSIRSTAPRIEAHYQYYNTSVESSLMVAQDAVCQVWAHYDGSQYCTPSLEHAQQPVSGDQDERILPFDRVLGDNNEAPLVLYADISDPSFGEFHNQFTKKAEDGQFSYRVRYRPSRPDGSQEPLFVSGYGVELVLKRTDYIVIDDREAEEKTGQIDEGAKPTLAADDLKEETTLSDLKPLSASEVSMLGIRAASFIMASDNPFETLLKLSQDFPKHSSAISQFNDTEKFIEEFQEQEVIPPGYNIMWINGVEINHRQVDAFSLLNHLRQERKLLRAFNSVGLSAREAVDLLSAPVVIKSHSSDEVPRYDYRDDVEGGEVIIWLNNLEKDNRYKDWSKSVTSLLQSSFPGQLPAARRDIHNVVLPADLADPDDVEVLVEQMQRFVKRRIPVRFGLVPTFQSAQSIEQAKVAHYLHETYGLGALLTYLEHSLVAGELSSPNKGIFTETINDLTPRTESIFGFEDVLATDVFDDALSKAKAYLERLAADGQSPPIFINGVAIQRDESWLQHMIARVSKDLEGLQRGIMGGIFDNDSWLPHYYLDDAALKRNPLIIPENPDDIKVLDLNGLYEKHRGIFENLPRIPAAPETSLESWTQLLLIADFDNEAGLEQLREALDFRTQNPGVEVVLLPVPKIGAQLRRLSARIYSLSRGNREVDVASLRSLLDSGAEGLKVQDPESDMAKDYSDEVRPLMMAMGVSDAETHLMMNGRIVGPISGGSTLDARDIEQLLVFERRSRLRPVATALSSFSLSDRISDPASFARLTSLVARSTEADLPEGLFDSGTMLRSNFFARLADSSQSAITVSNTDESPIEIVTAIDPTTEVAQRWAPILRVLSQLDGVALKIYLNPRTNLQELPIKRFYRHVLEPEPSFSESGSLIKPQATFNNLPDEALLTLGMDVAPSWLVASKESLYDLDNLKLGSLQPGSNVDVIYELEHILIEGHSRDVTNDVPPRGVQLLLGTENNRHFADTIIMANLGYFQFKAQPGHWKITLKPGQSERIFHIDSVEGKGPNPTLGDENNDVALLSFQGKTLFPRLSRKPGHEEDDVLEAGSKPASAKDYLSKGMNFASGVISSLTGSQHDQHADINIFSVASGHLYERMLNIMMLSVMEHTKHSVKFWFIEQFLSPSFKSLLPHLAKEYGFSYEMVTYKWPHWLRAQREKQREIWGYKILFLDVLFPLSLDKVIFVDADQIVRTDLYDLVNLDLEGAPYGFTPMCDSRESMEGFRFWKQGYWEKFLRGLPYHISALYVVDLNRFRQIAAGDRLRGQYHTLSADPNSLSNLDQDLPNHMQHMIPIKSLPQDWLWCETWCSDEALATAKTIDLCNNPLTKEPKLDRARRQVPEWTRYDDQVAQLAKIVAEREEQGEAGEDAENEGIVHEDEADRKDEL